MTTEDVAQYHKLWRKFYYEDKLSLKIALEKAQGMIKDILNKRDKEK